MKLNLGCGPHTLPGWTNIDLEQHPGITIRHDLSRGLPPMPRASVDLIFSEHFIEHITLEQAQDLMRDCYRVLKPGGTIRISTPSLNYLIELYARDDLKQWSPTWDPKTRCRMVNEGMRMWGHQFLYDGPELSSLMRVAGFDKIVWCRHRESSIPELANLEVRPYVGDLILEATK